MPPNERLDPRIIAQRLLAAREARGLTQEAVAKHLGCSRPTLIAMEKGERLAKPAEIVALAALYGRSVHDLVRQGEPVTGLRPHFRSMSDRMKTVGDGLQEAVAILEKYAANYARLEQVMGVRLKTNYPPEVALNPRIDPRDLAEDVATRERDRLGLGDGPILNLRETAEWSVGLRVFYAKMPAAIEGLFAFVDELGCFILVNSAHRPVKQRATIAHEWGHLIGDRYRPGADIAGHGERKPANERFAEAFAMAFLMPASGVRRRFHEIVGATGDFQVADLCRLSHHYYVSVQAMTLRLEDLKLVPSATWDTINASKVKTGKVAEELGLPTHPIHDAPYPEHYAFLAAHAWDQDKITETELMDYLGCQHRIEARAAAARILETRELDGEDATEAVRLEFQRSLLTRAS